MSYSIIRSISQTSPGVFRISSTCSNVYPRNFSEPYESDYYLRLYPNRSKAQYEVMRLMDDVFNGTVYYPAAWKAKQAVVCDFINAEKEKRQSEFEITHGLESGYFNDWNKTCEYNKAARESGLKEFDEYSCYDKNDIGLVNRCAEYLESRIGDTIRRKFIIKCSNNGYYVSKLTKKGYKYGLNKVVLNLNWFELDRIKSIARQNNRALDIMTA